jgi:DNA-binding winged helix-turn-helix (wHTH) protein/tetratricopeptide (TPR) repeat protein
MIPARGCQERMKTQRETYFEFGPFRLEPGEGRLTRDGLIVPLTPKAFEMLLVLVRGGGSLVDKDLLLQTLWPDAFVEETNLTFTISVIRKALGESARTARYIATVPKRGYRFTAPVREVHAERQLKSLAVLPFVPLSRDDDSRFFADGMQEALIAELAQIRSLRVISRTSSVHDRRGTRPLADFARALQLDVVVEGSVLLDGDRARIGVRLIDAVGDRHLWAQHYERHLREVASWPAEVAKCIAQEIEVTLTAREHARLGAVYAVDPEAHIAYLLGRYYWHHFFTEAAFKTAIGHFRRATDRDPGYAPAWSGLADCFAAMTVQSMVPPDHGAAEARRAASTALALDPSLPDAQISMAGVHLFFDWKWTAAEAALKSALDLSPSASLAHGLFTHYAVARGWATHAIASARRALDLDPVSPVANVDLAWAYLLTGDYPRALDQCLSILDKDVTFPLARIYLSQVHQCMGNAAAAIEEMEKAVPAAGEAPAPGLAMLGYAYGIAGATGAARDVARRMEDLRRACYVSDYDWAVLHTGLGEHDRAEEHLRRALQERSPRMIWIELEPAFGPLRRRRSFQAIVRQLGLT